MNAHSIPRYFPSGRRSDAALVGVVLSHSLYGGHASINCNPSGPGRVGADGEAVATR